MGNGNGGGNGRYVAQDFIDKIPGSGGIISTIAKRVGCAWHTAKKYCTEYATVAKVYQDECESITDLAESTVLKAIQEGDVSAAKWYLTMKAKDRGYAPRQEITGADGGPMESDITMHVPKEEHDRAMATFYSALERFSGGADSSGQDAVATAE